MIDIIKPSFELNNQRIADIQRISPELATTISDIYGQFSRVDTAINGMEHEESARDLIFNYLTEYSSFVNMMVNSICNEEEGRAVKIGQLKLFLLEHEDVLREQGFYIVPRNQ